MLEPNKNQAIKGKSSWTQWIATLGVFMVMMQSGIAIGWASPNIARLTEKDSDIPLSKDQASWVASTMSVGGFGGALAATLFAEYIGGRKSILVALMINTISWICLIIANAPEYLYAFRILSGATCAMAFCNLSIFLGEISNPSVRGTLISIAAAGSPFGQVVGNVAESYLKMKISSSIYLVQCLLIIPLFLWLKDSPYYLVKINKYKRAIKAVNFYNKDCDTEKELNEIKVFVEATSRKSMKDKLKEFQNPIVRKSMLLICTLFALPYLSGMLNITAYMETILKDGGSNLIEPKLFVICANATAIAVSFCTIKLIDVFGRRFLLVLSSIGTGIAMASLGVHFSLLDSKVDPDTIQWLPLLAILIYLITYAIGFNTVPSTVLSEIFSQTTKSVASCVSNLSVSLFSFVLAKAYQPILDTLGYKYAFFMHFGLALLGIPVAVFFLPETKGKTFQEIQNLLDKR